MSDLKFDVKYRVPAYIIYQALTDQSYMSKYMQCKLNYLAKVDTEFDLYESAITGKIKELVENKKIIQTWKFNNWPSEAELKITISERKGDECLVNVNLKNIPIRDDFNKIIEHEVIKNGFYQQIFDRISLWLGYPQNKDESDSDDE